MKLWSLLKERPPDWGLVPKVWTVLRGFSVKVP